MKLTTITILILATAITLSAQKPQVAAKPAEAAKTTSVVPVAQMPPSLPSTARLWRLVAKAQALRQQVEETPQAKAAKEAESELQAEQAKLQSACGSNFVLGYDADVKSLSYQDLVCQLKPPEQAKAEPPKGK